MTQPSNETPPDDDSGRSQAKNICRMRGFVGHLLGYFIGMGVIVPVNLFFTPDRHWFLFPMVGWGGLLAVHVAYVMGFFDRSTDRRD